MRPIHDRRESKRQHHRRGMTLVEAMISIVVVAVMLTTAVGMVGSAAKMRKIQAGQMRAPAVATALMTEVLAARYQDTDKPTNWGTESGENGSTRENYDDIDDYDGWTSVPPKYKNGQALPGCTGWKENIKVYRASLSDPSATFGSETGLRRICVTITDDRGAVTTLTALRTADRDQAFGPGNSAANINWAAVRLDVAETEAPVISGVVMLNQPGGNPSAGELMGNSPPKAKATAVPGAGQVPLTVVFDASGSTDPDAGDTLTYQWDLGDTTTSTEATVTHVYSNPGDYVVTCVVTDDKGAADSKSMTVRAKK